MSAQPPSPHLGRVLGGQYRVESLLGQGGMGAVYRGTQLSVQRAVAIKLIGTGTPNPEQTFLRFRREAEATARLQHPNTVRLFDFGMTETHELYMVMELLEGCDLAARLTQGPLPLREALSIVRQVLSALSEAHALGIVHRDLKPGNVFLSRVHGGESFVKVMDFGIAGIAPGAEAQKLTVTGAVMGTPAYMSPEQAQGKPVDARSDLYSIGVMLFEMLTGKPPFEADTLVSMLIAHVTLPPKRLADAGARFAEVARVQTLLDRLLAKQPDGRPGSAAELAKDIDALLAGGPLPAVEVQVQTAATLGAPQPSQPLTPLHWDQNRPPAERGRGSWRVAALVGLVALGAAGAFWFTRAPAPSAQPTAASAEPPLGAAPAPAAASGKVTSAQAEADEPARTAGTLEPAKPAGHDESQPAPDGRARDNDARAQADGTAPAPGARPQAQAADARPAPPVEDGAQTAASERSARRERARAAHGRKASGRARAEQAEPDEADAPAPDAPSSRPDSPVLQVREQSGAARPDLNRAPPYPSMAAAKRAYDGGKINAAAYEAALALLKARRTQRIALERENLARGTITPQEYEWRLGRIDAEYRGE